jgi:cytochrome c oxidase subunit 1
VFSFFMMASVGLLAFNVIWSLKYGKIAGINPWGARTLEWTISSPPPYYNFKKLPEVFDRPYNFDQPLPYRNTDNELEPYPQYGMVTMPTPQPAGAGAH